MFLNGLVLLFYSGLLAFAPIFNLAHAGEPDITLVLKNEFSIKNLMEVAFSRNAKLKSAEFKWKATIERYPQVTAFEDPEIGIDTWNIPTDFSISKSRNTIYWITQKFPFPGKLGIKGDIVSQEVKAARTVFEMTTRDVVAKLKTTYYELIYLDKAIGIIRKNKKLAEHLSKISATEYSADATTLNDVLKAQSQLGQLDNDLILLTELYEVEVAHINTTLDFPPDQPIGKPNESFFVPFDMELNHLYQMAREHRQELKINGLEIEKNQKKVELAKKQYYPDFRATFKWFDNNGISQDEGVGILFGFNVPIWFGKNRSRVSEARNNLQALEYEKKDLENTAFAMINKVYFKIKNSSRTVRLYKETLIPQALNSLDIAETWYKQNKGSFAGLLEARSVWLNFNLAYERALADHFQHIAKLEKLIGANLETTKNKENRK
jgi:cobalt-zinc-cadmium efflux system outer membrane protein